MSDVPVPTTSGQPATKPNPLPVEKEDAGGGNGGGPAFGAELSTLDFGQILGGPLVAAVNAEAQSAMVTLQYIESVGFAKNGNTSKKGGDSTHQVQNVEFTYDRVDGSTKKTESLTVPLLAMVPIPWIRISQLSVDLNVKLQSVSQSKSDNDLTTNTVFGSQNSLFSAFSPVSFQCTITDQATSQATSSVDRTYTLDVKLLAVQDAMPAGLNKVLQIFEDAISPAATPAPAKIPPPHK
jgi:Protein of unknown function (DUF2589)